MQSNLNAVLSQEHLRLDALFQEVISVFQANDQEGALKLWTRFQEELDAHFGLEEREIIPELAKVNPKEAALILCEHDEIRKKVDELGIGVELHFARLDAVTDLIRRLRAHSKRENELMYVWAQDHLASQKQVNIITETLGEYRLFAGVA